MNEVPGMNIINKFADSLGMRVVNLNIRMCLFVFAPENQLVSKVRLSLKGKNRFPSVHRSVLCAFGKIIGKCFRKIFPSRPTGV